MKRALAVMLIVAGISPAQDKSSWQNLSSLRSNQPIEVLKTSRESLNGEFVRFADDSISLRVKQQDVSVPRAEVARVRTRSKGHKAIWIGTAVGAGAGLAIGAAAGTKLATESGGDFANLKTGITVGFGAIGALIGAGFGSLTGHKTIYKRM